MLNIQEPVRMKTATRLLACLSLAVLSTAAAHAQLGYGNYPYGTFMAEHSGRMLIGYDEAGSPILRDYDMADAAGGWGKPQVGGLSHGMWTYGNPAWGGYVVTLDVPNATLHS